MIRILVVEDDRDISALIQLALKNAGYDVFAAFDGQEGANLLETQKFELCLLDIMLPQISGYELFSYINEYSIPVIFITARGELDDKRKAFRMGADDYIVKPFEIEELLLRTENILRLHGYNETCGTSSGTFVDRFPTAFDVFRLSSRVHRAFGMPLRPSLKGSSPCSIVVTSLRAP